MRSYRLIFCLLSALLLAGCDYEKDQLKTKNQELSSTVESLSKELQDYKTGAEAAWQAEYFFRRELDHAAACQLIFELPIFCPRSLAEARAKVLAEANKKGIGSLQGWQYISTLVLSLSGGLTVFFAGWAGWLVLVDPTRTSIRQREEKIGSAQADLEKIHQAGKKANAELDRARELVQTEVKELAKIKQSREEAIEATKQAHAQAAKAQGEAADLEKSLATLKAFNKI